MTLLAGLAAQTRFADRSVLSAGKWIKFSTTAEGVYSISGDDLRKSGFENVATARIRLFGNGGRVLPESNAIEAPDDLKELAIWVEDGGDGQFSGNDYLLFYAPAASQWVFDSISRQVVFEKNPYTDKVFFYLTVGEAAGKLISTAATVQPGGTTVVSYDELYRYELDSINFLRSGKEWYGEDFGNQQGRVAARVFPVLTAGAVPGTKFSIASEIAGRSADQPNKVVVSVNGSRVLEHTTAPLAGTLLEPSANTSRITGEGRLESAAVSVGYNFTGTSVNAQAWLNWFEVRCRRVLDLAGVNQLGFRDLESVSVGQTATFRIMNPKSDARIWDISAHNQVINMPVVFQNGQLSFNTDVSRLKEFIAFSPTTAPRAIAEGTVENQDLHSQQTVNLLIVADPSLMQAAERLAAFHRQRGLSVHIEFPSRIYNEFSAGIADPTAIRNYVRMLHTRSSGSAAQQLRYLLLFGGASYIFKGAEGVKTNQVPSYQSDVSLDPLSTYVTDDYFGYLDSLEDIRAQQPAPMLDLAIGRIPARTLQQANTAVDKIISYHQPASLGSWRTGLTLVADDEDFNLHLYDAEYHAEMIKRDFPDWQVRKIYLDAYEQQSNAGGSRYPEVNRKILDNVNSGTLIWNYSGHGGSSRLAQEVVLDASTLSDWENTQRLPLLITATCDFAPFDDPAQFSLGEELLVGRKNGGIGLMTTTRLVFASSNKVINHNFLRYILRKDKVGRFPAIGDALRDSKNFTVSSSGDYINARKFIMLGDPAMKLAMPEWTIKTTHVNGRLIKLSDTLQARTSYELEGVVLDQAGLPLTSFNGFVYPRLFDKPVVEKTRANDPQSQAVDFLSNGGVLLNAKVPVSGGKFKFTFSVPSDADIRYGRVKLLYYADDGSRDAMGMDDHFTVGGRNVGVVSDNTGPAISIYLDKETFRSGDRVSQTPMIIIRLSDVSGFNLSGNGVGHDLIAMLDGDARTTLVLNDFFVPEVAASGFAGSVRLRLPALNEGRHRLFVRGWDVYNNPGEAEVEFEVYKKREITITGFRAYPNPLQPSTVFNLTLEGDTRESRVLIAVLSGDGKVVWTQEKAINEANLRSLLIVWDGPRKQDGSLPPGVYYCRVLVINREGMKTSKTVKVSVL
jgi:hypothetical protein